MKYSEALQTLSLKEGFKDEELSKAYKKLAFEFHPDRNNGNKEAEEKFKKVSAAHDILKGKERAEDALPKMNYGGMGDEMNYGFGDNDFLQDILTGFMQGMRTMSISVPLTLEQLTKTGYTNKFSLTDANGKKNTFSVNLAAGNIDPRKPHTVFDSKGHPIVNLNWQLQVPQGMAIDRNLDVFVDLEVPYSVQVMGGKTQVIDPITKENLTVTVPAGTKNFSKIRLKNKGILVFGKRTHLFYNVHTKLYSKPLSPEHKELLEKLLEIETKDTTKKDSKQQ